MSAADSNGISCIKCCHSGRRAAQIASTDCSRSSRWSADHDGAAPALASATPLPPGLELLLTQHIDGIYDLIRRTRMKRGIRLASGWDERKPMLFSFYFPRTAKRFTI